MTLRPSRAGDLAWITALERRPDHLDAIGQWSDAEHLASHWIIEREGERESGGKGALTIIAQASPHPR